MDTYLESADATVLAAFCAAYENVIGPAPGRAESEERIMEDGMVLPAQPAAGDPTLFYACVRSDDPLDLSAQGISMCAREIGAVVVGVWS